MSETELSTSAYEGFTAVEVDGMRHWVKNGYTIDDLAFVYKERIDPKKGRPYFINLKEKASVWKLPTATVEADAGTKEKKEKKKKKSDADKEGGGDPPTPRDSEAGEARSAKKSSSRSSSSSKKASTAGEADEGRENTDESKKKKKRSKSANSSEGDALSPTTSASNTPREKRRSDKPSRASSPQTQDVLVSALSPVSEASPGSGISKVRKKSPSSSKSRALLDAALAKATSSSGPFQSEPTDGSPTTLASGDAGGEGPTSPPPVSKKRVAGTKVKAKKKLEEASHEEESISSLLASLKPKAGDKQSGAPSVGLLGEVDAVLGAGKGGEEGGLDDILSQLTSFERRVNKSDTPAPTRGATAPPAEVIRQTLQADAEERRAAAAEALKARVAETGGVNESKGHVGGNNGTTDNRHDCNDMVPGERAVSLSSVASAVPLVSVPASPMHARQKEEVVSPTTATAPFGERPLLDGPKKSGEDSLQPQASARPSFVNPFKASAVNTNSDASRLDNNVGPQPFVVEGSSADGSDRRAIVDEAKSVTSSNPKNVFNPFATDAFPTPLSSSVVSSSTNTNDQKEKQENWVGRSLKDTLLNTHDPSLPETKPPPALSRNAKAFAALWDDIATSSASVGARTQVALASLPPSSQSLRADPRNASLTSSAIAPREERATDIHTAPSSSVFDVQKGSSSASLSRGLVKDQDVGEKKESKVADLKSTRSGISSSSNENARVDEQQRRHIREHTKNQGKDEEEAFLRMGTGPTTRVDNTLENPPKNDTSNNYAKTTDDIDQPIISGASNSNTKGILKPTSPLMSPQYAFSNNTNSFPPIFTNSGGSDATSDRFALLGANNSFSSTSRPITPRRSAASRVVKFVDLSDDPLAAENNRVTEAAQIGRGVDNENDKGGSRMSSHALENTSDRAVQQQPQTLHVHHPLEERKGGTASSYDYGAVTTTAGGTLRPPSYFSLSSFGGITGSRLEDDPEYSNAYASAAAVASSKKKTKKEAGVHSNMPIEADIVSFEEVVGPVIEKSLENVPHIDVGDGAGMHRSSPCSVEGKDTGTIGASALSSVDDLKRVVPSAVTPSSLFILEALEDSSSTGLPRMAEASADAIDTSSTRHDHGVEESQSIDATRDSSVEDKDEKQNNLLRRERKEAAVNIHVEAGAKYDGGPRGESTTTSGALDLDGYLTAAEIELRGLLLERLSHVKAKKLAITLQTTAEWNTTHMDKHSRPLSGGENEEAKSEHVEVKYEEDTRMAAEEGAEELARTREANTKRKSFRRARKSSIYESFISLLEEGFFPFSSGCDDDNLCSRNSPLPPLVELDRRIRSRDGVVSEMIDGWLKDEKERKKINKAHDEPTTTTIVD